MQLSAVPLDLAPLLRELLFDRLDTVVLTSATLAASGDFDFLESRLGLGGESSPVTERQIFPSPFDYPSQCLFGVPTDLPEPREDEVGHGAAVVQIVCDLAYASDGGMFVLFTSHASLRRAAAELRMALGTRWPLLVQGEAPRDVLLRRFREAENAILLGTDSFWEGVDVPGRALRALVINKLPFKVPTEPLTAARLERLAEEGQDGFVHYLLPHAALKLKQGFGRLDPEPEGPRGRRACSTAARSPSGTVPCCSADCRGRSGWWAPGARCGPSARISSRGTESEPSYDRAAPLEDHRHRPQLRGPREGAGQRDARRPHHLLQAADLPHR